MERTGGCVASRPGTQLSGEPVQHSLVGSSNLGGVTNALPLAEYRLRHSIFEMREMRTPSCDTFTSAFFRIGVKQTGMESLVANFFLVSSCVHLY